MDAKENIITTKSEDFAVRIINLYKYLCADKKDFVLSKQILKSGTSICANVAEATCGISRNDFLAKIYISFKECNETLCWLRLLNRTDFITKKQFLIFNS
ncbi:MAG: four helix bundle protein [Rickettsiales bacterium]|jgi:four helix bundle protein|nr:four helix bundle protein [Rickettsiales bacterium]